MAAIRRSLELLQHTAEQAVSRARGVAAVAVLAAREATGVSQVRQEWLHLRTDLRSMKPVVRLMEAFRRAELLCTVEAAVGRLAVGTPEEVGLVVAADRLMALLVVG